MELTNFSFPSLLNETFVTSNPLTASPGIITRNVTVPTTVPPMIIPQPTTPHLPIPSWLKTTFVPYNQRPEMDANVTTNDTKFMICAVVKDEELYIDEWLEYHKFLGFDYVMLHDNADNRSEYLLNLPQKYSEYVTIHHGPGYKQQDVNYKKCLDTFRNTSIWAAFIDVDEFLVLHKHKTVREYVLDVAPHGSSISILRDQYTANHFEQYEPYPVLSRFIARQVTADHRVKSLAYLPHVNHTFTHHVRLLGNLSILDAAGNVVKARRLERNGILNGNTRTAAVNHYFTKSFEEFTKKRLRGFAGHSELNDKYQGVTGRQKIVNEFLGCNEVQAVIDTFAWDFYRAKKAEQLGHAYGEDFPKRLNVSEFGWYCNDTLCEIGPPHPLPRPQSRFAYVRFVPTNSTLHGLNAHGLYHSTSTSYRPSNHNSASQRLQRIKAVHSAVHSGNFSSLTPQRGVAGNINSTGPIHSGMQHSVRGNAGMYSYNITEQVPHVGNLRGAQYRHGAAASLVSSGQVSSNSSAQ